MTLWRSLFLVMLAGWLSGCYYARVPESITALELNQFTNGAREFRRNCLRLVPG